MAMRLNEVHPSLTHYPIAMIPVAMGVEFAAKITGREDLDRLGRVAVPSATAAAVATGLSGLMVEQQVRGSEEAGRMLSRHRNLNLGVVAATTAMSAYRIGGGRPGWGYLLGGAASVGTLLYSAYLGGRMVYGEGMGVEDAGGLRFDESPPVRLDNVGELLATAGRQIGRTIRGLFKGLIPREFDYGPDAEDYRREMEVEHRAGRALPLGE